MVRSPSFSGYEPTTLASSKAKRANRRDNTRPEVLLRQALWKQGLRYRKNVRALLGNPDIVFPRSRLLVFCDGDFWHGRNWAELAAKLQQGANAGYWVAKIASNVERDSLTTAELERQGWHVLRLWETDIKRDPLLAARRITDALGKTFSCALKENRADEVC
jgi:DNA mismatch endonuclease (patch repair protein)